MENKNIDSIELENIIEKKIVNIMSDNHNVFAEYTTLRIIPDFRDGFKTVQRRILFAMNEINAKHFVKSMRVVGEVIGKYHPHGDAPIYGAMVKMAQDFGNNLLFVVPQGHFGSIDGFAPASPRYTEIRLANLSEDTLFKFLYKNNILWKDNFDNTLKEPAYFPAILPFALINGVFGIGVGISTTILPHNTGELINSLIMMLENENTTLDDLLTEIQGPDFPTGGEIFAPNLRQIYENGSGSIKVRGIIFEEESKLIISELPYNVSLNTLLEELGQLRKKNQNLKEIFDETDKNGIRIVINLASHSVLSFEKENIFKGTSMEKSFSTNMSMLKDDRIKYYNLYTYLKDFSNHLITSFTQNLQFELNAKLRQIKELNLHIWAANNAEEIISVLKISAQPKEDMKAKFNLSSEEINSILNFRLYKLANFELTEAKNKITVFEKERNFLQECLSVKTLFIKQITTELENLKSKYSIARKSIIIAKFEDENDFEVILMLLDGKYIYKLPDKEIKIKNLRTKSIKQKFALGIPNFILKVKQSSMLYLFTNTSRLIKLSIKNLSFGMSNNLSDMKELNSFLEQDEFISTAIEIEKDMFVEKFICLVTASGKIAKFKLNTLIKTRTGTALLKIQEDDYLSKLFFAVENDNIFIATENGKLTFFNSNEVRTTNKKVLGVRGMIVAKEDKIISAGVITDELFIFTILGKGKGLKFNPNVIHRGGKGFRMISLNHEDKVASVINCTEDDKEFILLTKKGFLFKSFLSKISSYGKTAKGHIIISLDEDDSIVKLTF